MIAGLEVLRIINEPTAAAWPLALMGESSTIWFSIWVEVPLMYQFWSWEMAFLRLKQQVAIIS